MRVLWAAGAKGTHRAERSGRGALPMPPNKVAAREGHRWMLQSRRRWLQDIPWAGIPQGRLGKPSFF